MSVLGDDVRASSPDNTLSLHVGSEKGRHVPKAGPQLRRQKQSRARSPGVCMHHGFLLWLDPGLILLGAGRGDVLLLNPVLVPGDPGFVCLFVF